jgi:polyferredoxin
MLRWKQLRPTVQLIMLSVATGVVVHGLFGPQWAPRNVATVSVWIHYRGLLALCPLIIGNLMCFACPAVLVRDWARRVLRLDRTWPQALRSKWAVGVLMATALRSYEWFEAWTSPTATATLIIAFLVAAVATDVVFTGATFCKYVCPIGQFNSCLATLAPTEIAVKLPNVCASCRTADCIVGRKESNSNTVRGCEMGLFVPLKSGNLDCTLCLDCVHACPQSNVALILRRPARDLARGGWRSSLGRIDERLDFACMTLLFACVGLGNAFGMTSVVVWLGAGRATVSIAPLLIIGVAVIASVVLGDNPRNVRRALAVGSVSLLPIGAAIWIAHYLHHFLHAFWTLVPVVQGAVRDVTGMAVLGRPRWDLVGFQGPAPYLIEVLVICWGAVCSLHLIESDGLFGKTRSAAWPWKMLVMTFALLGVLAVSMPMSMSGVGGQ